MKSKRARGRRRPWRIVILVRRIDVAVALSLLVHLVLFALPGPKPPPPASAGAPPMQVVIAEPRVREPQPPEETPQPLPRPITKPTPRPPTVASPPRPVTRPTPSAPPQPQVEPTPTEEPTPRPTPAAPVDMMAAIEARRSARRAAEAARAGPPGPPAEDAATRNLRTLTGGEGVGGVFEILEKGTRRATFAFNGWRPESRGQWRTVIEVDAGLGGNVEVAIVRRMIELIREYYKEDFRWDSRRLDRVVTLSARPEDTAGLEEFLMKEFFGAPPPVARRR